ncbi:cytochrome P450 [Multifurca ochricompacta]|uniref:Cytochrome P450 n=1 Tax=Multifurca ochricompacta TaxID=376703 RepID=A0AAD4LU60_9AGAM|nr:cytochrome P450 [Multifurca ochricompacta]
MQFSLIVTVDCLALSVFIYTLIAFRDHRRRRGLPYPPGPPSWPVIGNLLDVPKRSPWAAYADLSKKYGDVVCLRLFGQIVVVLCSLNSVKDLLEKRGELYADRPPVPIFELMDVDWTLPIAKKGRAWREGRRLLDRSLRPGATALHRQLIEEKTRIFLGQLLSTPKDFRAHVDLLQGRLIMSLTYGYDLKENDKIMIPVRVTGEIMSRLAVPGAALVNHLPFLKHVPSWFPWFTYEPLAGMCRELSQRMKNEPIDFVKNAMQEGTAIPSLAGEYLQEAENLDGLERQVTEQIIKDTLGSMFQDAYVEFELSAGSDTARFLAGSSMSSLFLALAIYPEVQKRAQAELDSVVSRDRLPTSDDKSRLPYIEAMCKELLRWQMVTPMGVPHASTEDDIYKGFFIPKGSFDAIARAILHNPKLYPDPETFKPERFLNKEDGTFRDDPTILLAFGAGKRICPGRHFVDATLFVVISSVLSVFNVTKAKNKDGNDIPIEVATSVEGRIAIQPAKFDCSITPRDKVAEDLIKAGVLA